MLAAPSAAATEARFECAFRCLKTVEVRPTLSVWQVDWLRVSVSMRYRNAQEVLPAPGG